MIKIQRIYLQLLVLFFYTVSLMTLSFLPHEATITETICFFIFSFIPLFCFVFTPSFIYRLISFLIFFILFAISYTKYNGWVINQYFWDVVLNSCFEETTGFLSNLFLSRFFWHFFLLYALIPFILLLLCLSFHSLSKKIYKIFNANTYFTYCFYVYRLWHGGRGGVD